MNVFFLGMVILLLPYIIKSGWQGSFFLGVVVVYMALQLLIVLLKRKAVQESKSYNILTIALSCYLGIIFTRIMFVELNPSVLYELSLNYCRNNFFLLAITIICMILNTILIIFAKEKD